MAQGAKRATINAVDCEFIFYRVNEMFHIFIFQCNASRIQRKVGNSSALTPEVKIFRPQVPSGYSAMRGLQREAKT